ncbi:HesB/YadR/YfhF family protein [Paenibacillus xanthanilyticus]|uniref:HesB/YadR/YfhF family protein n=1 Tax=Paenibacillus xanthanilyticus TaxID=1783531 RepID=A0ABV8K567_9BACL
MRIIVDPTAARWYKEELAADDGEQLQIFVYLGGCGSVQPGLSLGIVKKPSDAPRMSAVEAGVEFYMLEDQLWYLDNRDLQILFDAKRDMSYIHVDGE